MSNDKPLMERLGDKINELNTPKNHAPSGRHAALSVRRYPKKITPSTINNRQAIFSFRAVHRTWWMIGGLVAVFAILPVLSFGLGALVVEEIGIAIVAFVIAIFLTVVVITSTFPVVYVSASPQVIQVGKYVFDRRYADGFRAGYDQTSSDNSFAPMTGFRMSYGPWGENLPYMVAKNVSVEMVNWMNGVIDQIPVEVDAPTEDQNPEAQTEVF